jgi:hypothetical protein
MRASLLLLAFLSILLAPAAATAPTMEEPFPQQLVNDLRRSYLDLFDSAPAMTYTPGEIASARKYMESAEDGCSDRFKARKKEHERALSNAQDRLRREGTRLSGEARHDLHCTIQNTRILAGQVEVLLKHGIPVAFDNRDAKLDLIEKWPAEQRTIERARAEGTPVDGGRNSPSPRNTAGACPKRRRVVASMRSSSRHSRRL